MGDVAGPVGREEFLRAKRLAGFALVLGLAAATIALLQQFGLIHIPFIMQSTEEPPIRVRNGSQDVIVYSDAWDPDSANDKKNWHLHSGKMHKNLTLDVVLFAGPDRCKGFWVSATDLQIDYTDGVSRTNTIHVTLKNKKVSVSSEKDLSPTSNASDVVSYPGAGYISQVIVDGNPEPFCTFKAKTDLGSIAIYDW